VQLRVRLSVAAFLALIVLLLAWAVWLLVTNDPDGGRHPMGVVILVAALLLGLAGMLLARRPRRRL